MTGAFVLVHTIPLLVDAFDGWCRVLLPGVRPLHVLDEPLLERIKARGERAPEDDDRLAEHVSLAEAIGAAAVLVTCSTVSLSAESIRPRFRVPILTIDEPMVRAAVVAGSRILVVATALSTLEPSRLMLEHEGRRVGKELEVRCRLVEDALPALLAGEPETHDRLVLAAIDDEIRSADVVVLAQATMARVLEQIDDGQFAVPILASPQLALAEVRRAIEPCERTSPAPFEVSP